MRQSRPVSRASIRFTLLAALLLVACGSRSPLEASSDLDPDAEHENENVDLPANGGSGATPSGNGGSGPAPDANGGSGGTSPPGDALPECVLGPPRASPQASGAACNWVVSERCYERRVEACACACPRDRNSTCVSGSPGLEVGVACS